MSRDRAVNKKVWRRNWRQRGIRLNADTPLSDVAIKGMVLGSGSFGAIDVRVAEWCGAKVAAKALMDAPDDPSRSTSPTDESSLDLRAFNAQQRRVLQECHLMGQLRHPNIAQVYGVYLRPDGCPVIISELLGESLEQRLVFGTRLTYRDIVDISLDILHGLRYLHTLAHPLLHGSVSSTNTLFSLTGSVKLTDSNLALARLHSPGTATPVTPQTERALDARPLSQLLTDAPETAAVRSHGVRRYLPLDALDHDCYDLGVDAYAFGVLVMAMALHREPCSVEVPKAKRPSSASAGGAGRLERMRRSNDLNRLAEEGPAFVNLVNKCMDAIPAANAAEADGAGSSENLDSIDCDVERASTKDLLEAVQGMTKTDDYARWPSTRASAAVRGLQEQAELAVAIRRLEAQVQNTVKAAEERLTEQENELAEQVKTLQGIHQEKRQQLVKRIKELEREAEVAGKEARPESLPGKETPELELDDVPGRRPIGSAPDLRQRSLERNMTAKALRVPERDSSTEGAEPVTSPEGKISSDEVDSGIPSSDTTSQQSFIRQIHVKIPNGGLTTVQIDDRNSVVEIVQCLCEEHGLPNHEEYSLLLEAEDAFSEKLKKDMEKNRKTFRGEKKLESIKRRFRPNDAAALKWLQHDKTLQEQGVDGSSQVLTMKRHASGSNVHAVGSNEPDTEYLDCKTSIIDGVYPCSMDEACMLASLQCHAQFGAYPENNKARVKSIQDEVKEYFPSYLQRHLNKRVVMKVMTKYADSSPTMTAAVAEQRYISFCKALLTYGAAIFVAKTGAKNKNKLVACILAVTKENFMKIDEKSREVAQRWPIKIIRRWSNSHELIQLDIGETEPLSFMTHEAQSIANLISIYKGIRSPKREEQPMTGHDYAEVSSLAAPRSHALVSRSESTYLPKSPRMVQRRRTSAEAPARISGISASPQPTASPLMSRQSPLTMRARSMTTASSSPTYAVLEVREDTDSGWSTPDLTNDYLSPQDMVPSRSPGADGDEPLMITVDEPADQVHC